MSVRNGSGRSESSAFHEEYTKSGRARTFARGTTPQYRESFELERLSPVIP
jgi:hypothetical protein